MVSSHQNDDGTAYNGGKKFVRQFGIAEADAIQFNIFLLKWVSVDLSCCTKRASYYIDFWLRLIFSDEMETFNL